MRIAFGIAVLSAVMALAGVVLVQPWNGSDTVSAKTVVERAVANRQSLVRGLGPDTTLHAVEKHYQLSAVAPGPFVLPERTHGQWWAYFGSDGKIESYRSEAYDDATGTLVQTGAFIDGKYVITDAASGESRSFSFDTDAQDVVQELASAQLDTAALVEPDGAAESVEVGGSDAYLVAMAAGDGSRRSYIDKETYREVKWEVVDSTGTVTESKETPVFEVLPGRAEAVAR